MVRFTPSEKKHQFIKGPFLLSKRGILLAEWLKQQKVNALSAKRFDSDKYLPMYRCNALKNKES